MKRSPPLSCASFSPGFTLMETLVVLVIVGLVSTVLFDGVTRMFGVRARLSQHVQMAEQRFLAFQWFRKTVESVYPDVPNGNAQFTGTPEGFSGLTLYPLNRDIGAPTVFGWRLEGDEDTGDAVLRYTETDQTDWTVYTWPGDGRFFYLDRDFVWHTRWPPPGTQREANTAPERPRLVRLDIIPTHDAPISILATPQLTERRTVPVIAGIQP